MVMAVVSLGLLVAPGIGRRLALGTPVAGALRDWPKRATLGCAGGPCDARAANAVRCAGGPRAGRGGRARARHPRAGRARGAVLLAKLRPLHLHARGTAPADP